MKLFMKLLKNLDGRMKTITCISDTHGSHWDIDMESLHGDIIIHAGDWSNMGRVQELTDFNQWLGNVSSAMYTPRENIICIAGNHDKYPSVAGRDVTSKMFSNAVYLDNDLYEVEGFKIYGTPWSRTYGRWSFMKEENELDHEWNKIPEGIDILIVHTPPYGLLDVVPRAGHVGSTTLADHIFNRIKPKLVVCGHIHEGYGQVEKDGIKFVNASCLDADYDLRNKPLQIVL